MCRRSLLQCLNWAYPRSGEGLTFLFFAGLMASISLRLLIPFVCSFVSLFGAEPAVGRPPEGETPAAVSSASLAIDPQAQQFRPVITIAELDTLVNPYDAFMLRQTAAALQRALPKYFVRTVTIADAEAKTQIERLRPDFLFAPASFSGMTGVEAARIATRRTNLAQSAERSVGAVFAVRADSRFQSLADLRGRRVFAGLPTAIDGWLAAARELRQQGFEPDHFFGFVGYRNNAYPDVLSALLNGSTDAAILPACLLEAVRMHGLVRAEDIRVINAKTGDLACTHSTALYPDLSLWSLSSAPETAVRDMTVALLGLRDASGYEWLTNVSHADVDGLLKDLEIGPYAYLKDMSPRALIERHFGKVLAAAGFLLLLVLNELRLHALVRRRTRELAKAMNERERLAEEASAARLELAGFERRSIVQQMSSMIAHEINAPVGALRTWAAVIRMKCPQRVFRDDEASAHAGLEQALGRIDYEANRIADIVSSVRAYAKKEDEPLAACDLMPIIERAISAFRAEERSAERTKVVFSSAVREAWTTGRPLELEILFLNLVRNGASAMKSMKDSLDEPAEVRLTLDRPQEAANRWRIRVENPGVMLDAGSLERLNRKAASVSADPSTFGGLGLGLSICRGIADRHGASLLFEARPTGGAAAVVMIDARDLPL